MDILFVVPYVPDLVRVRPYNLIRSLSTRGHHLTVMTLWSTEQEFQAAEQLKTSCHQVVAINLPLWRSLLNCLQVVPKSEPLQAAYCWQPALARKIDNLMSGTDGKRKFDLIHVEHLRGARYGLHVKGNASNSLSGHNCRPPIVWDSVDSISHLFRQAAAQSSKRISRWLTRLDLQRTERYEGWLINQFERTLVTSAKDREALASLSANGHGSQSISVIPNGVDLDYFRPDPNAVSEPATLVISGKMSYHANISMVLYLVEVILPHVWSRRPDVKLWIVGKDPAKEILALSQNPAVTVTGTVHDIRPFLQRATLAVAPLKYGAGIQNKVLEAMACATPVVCTPKAIAALDIQPGKEVLVAQDPTVFAEMILKLLEEPMFRYELGQSGRQYVERNHQWTNIAAQLEEVYDEILN